MIDRFRDEYYFLSNFYLCPVEYEGQIFNCVESAFQAAKTLDKGEREKFTDMAPTKAKHAGRRVALRSDWETVKVDIMHELIRDKFTRNPELAEMLKATGDEDLIEGNNWNDRFWGVSKGKGQNHLGKILMAVRDEIQKIININNV